MNVMSLLYWEMNELCSLKLKPRQDMPLERIRPDAMNSEEEKIAFVEEHQVNSIEEQVMFH